MTKIANFIHGIYPRSATLVQTSRDFDRKRQTATELNQQQKTDFKNLLDLEESLKFDYVEDGKLTWHDIFRPIIEASEGMEVGALTRWFDNNCFYRQPIITGKIQLDEKKLAPFFHKLTPAKNWKVTLPSPFTFAKLAENTKSQDFEKTLDQITKLLSKVLVYLEEKGVAFVQFNEPYIPYHQSKKSEIKLLVDSLGAFKKAKGSMKLAVCGYFGDCAPLVTALSKSAAVDVIGVDFFKTALTSLPRNLPYDIIAGVVDGRNSLLEDPEKLHAFAEKVITHLKPDTLYLSNNSDLELLPEPVAKDKLKLLAKVKKSF